MTTRRGYEAEGKASQRARYKTLNSNVRICSEGEEEPHARKGNAHEVIMPSLTNGRMMCRVCSAAGMPGMARRRPANCCASAGFLKRSTDARTCCSRACVVHHPTPAVGEWHPTSLPTSRQP